MRAKIFYNIGTNWRDPDEPWNSPKYYVALNMRGPWDAEWVRNTSDEEIFESLVEENLTPDEAREIVDLIKKGLTVVVYAPMKMRAI
jgi:hypothetical protein